MRNTAPAAYTAVPIGVAVCSGHVPGILPVTFAGLSVTFPESPVTLGRNTHQALSSVKLPNLIWAAQVQMRRRLSCTFFSTTPFSQPLATLQKSGS